MSKVDTTMRPMSHRETPQNYKNYMNARNKQIEIEKQKEFEDSLRESANREVKSISGLYGANNIFAEALTQDSKKVIDLNRRKHKMKEDMIDMITNLTEKEFSRFEGSMIAFNLSNPR